MAQWYFLHRPGRVTVFVLNKDIALKNVLPLCLSNIKIV